MSRIYACTPVVLGCYLLFLEIGKVRCLRALSPGLFDDEDLVRELTCSDFQKRLIECLKRICAALRFVRFGYWEFSPRFDLSFVKLRMRQSDALVML